MFGRSSSHHSVSQNLHGKGGWGIRWGKGEGERGGGKGGGKGRGKKGQSKPVVVTCFSRSCFWHSSLLVFSLYSPTASLSRATSPATALLNTLRSRCTSLRYLKATHRRMTLGISNIYKGKLRLTMGFSSITLNSVVFSFLVPASSASRLQQHNIVPGKLL